MKWLPNNTAPSRQDASTSPQTLLPDTGNRQRERPTATGRSRIVLADDNADMRDYVCRLLNEHYDVEAVADGEAALAAVQRDLPHLVVADATMPRLDGFGLLQELRADPRTADLPVIMLSARAGEESRVAGIEAGADDYLVKPFSARELIARAGAHLQKARQRSESAKALRQSDQRLRLALNAAWMVAWEWDIVADRVELSENAADVFGLLPGSAVSKSMEVFALVHPDDVACLTSDLDRAIEHCDAFQMQFRMIRPDNGETIWVEQRGHAIADVADTTVRLVGVVMDITDRKRAENSLHEREEYLRAIVETTPECIKVVAADGTLLQMNPAGREMIEADPTSTVAGGCIYDLISPEYRNTFREFNKRICTGEDGVLAFDIVGRQGTRRNMETHAVPLKQSDGTFVQLALTRDVTARKQTEKRLRDNERRFRQMIDALPAAIYTTDSAGYVTHYNPAAIDISGRTPELGTDRWCVTWKLFAVDGQPMRHDECPMTIALKEGRAVHGAEIIAERPDGTRVWLQVYPTPLTNEKGKVIGGINMLVDITDRKRSEKVIRESEQRFRSLVSVITDIAWVTNPDGEFITRQEQWEGYTGQNWEAHRGFGWLEAIHPDDRASVHELWRQARQACAVYESQGRLWHAPSQKWRHFVARGIPLMNEAGTVREWIGACTDVEEEKRAERALQQSEAHFRSMADHAPTMLWVTNPDGSCTFLSRAWHQYTGQSEEEGLGLSWLNVIHPDDRQRSAEIFHNANNRREAFSFDHRLRRVDGEYRWAIDSGRPRFDDSGEFLGFIGAVIDVHERTQAEEFRSGQARVLEMVTSEQPLERILAELVLFIERQIPGAMGSILLLDEEGNHLCHGAAPHLPQEYNDAIHGIEIGPGVGSCGTAASRGERVVVVDIQTDPLWKQFKELAARHGLGACWSEPIRSSAGEQLGTTAIYFPGPRVPVAEELAALEATARFAGIAIERPRAQAALRESEKRFRALTSATSDIVYRMSADWTEMRQLEGQEFVTDTSEPTGSWLETYIPHDDRPNVMATIKRAIESKSVFELEHRVVRVDGSIGWTYSRAIPILGDGGEIVEWFGAATDVTARKEAEENLRKSHEELARFNRMAVGRELRMIELKKEINELCQQLDQTARFALAFDEQPEPSAG